MGTATPYYRNHGHFYLESNNIKNGAINFQKRIFITDDFYQRQKNNWLHTNDLVMVQSGHVGHTAVIPKSMNNTAAHAVIIFSQPKLSIDTYFLNYYFQTRKAKRNISVITTGNTIQHILASEMQKFKVPYTDLKEQHLLHELLVDLDGLIAANEQDQKQTFKITKNISSLMLMIV